MIFSPSEEPKMQSSQVITHVTMASYLPISRQHASPILSWKTLLTSPLSIGSSKTRMKYPDFSLESADCKCSSTSIIQVLQVQFPVRRHCQCCNSKVDFKTEHLLGHHLFDIWTAEVNSRIYRLKYSRKCLQKKQEKQKQVSQDILIPE